MIAVRLRTCESFSIIRFLRSWRAYLHDVPAKAFFVFLVSELRLWAFFDSIVTFRGLAADEGLLVLRSEIPTLHNCFFGPRQGSRAHQLPLTMNQGEKASN